MSYVLKKSFSIPEADVVDICQVMISILCFLWTFRWRHWNNSIRSGVMNDYCNVGSVSFDFASCMS